MTKQLLLYLIFFIFLFCFYASCFTKEYFTINNNYTNSIDLPINTTFNCSNFCGPKARCAITGEQCLTDLDCYGCKNTQNNDENNNDENNIDENNIDENNTKFTPKPYNSSGVLTYNMNPQYSKLTSDIGTRSFIYNSDINTPKPYLGFDKWTQSFNYGLELADDKLTLQYMAAPEQYRFLPTYPVTETVTGLFFDNGPTASNADI
jgi:hypothetical protein